MKIEAGKSLSDAIEKIEKNLGIDLDLNLTLVDEKPTLAESPKGTFTILPTPVKPGNDSELGEMATFKIELDPATYLTLESVEKIETFWKKDGENDAFTLEPGRPSCKEITGSAGQKVFECETDFLEEHAGEQTFYAFVHAVFLQANVVDHLKIIPNAGWTNLEQVTLKAQVIGAVDVAGNDVQVTTCR